MAKKCAWCDILLSNLQVMHFLIIAAVLHRLMLLYRQTQTILDVENIQHLLQLWKGYQSRLLNICLFLINMRSFCVSCSAQLSSVIRTAKTNNSGNFIFHNILALADLVESQEWAVSNDIWSEKCLPSLPSLSAHCIDFPLTIHTEVMCCAVRLSSKVDAVCMFARCSWYHCGQIDSKLPSQKKFSVLPVLPSDEHFPWDDAKRLAWGPGFRITCFKFVFV